ncbi:MAG: iron-containing alcohol dehydrogenase [bacterium]|nr:iron-containing alcohol dehydrogenase [bacterium]
MNDFVFHNPTMVIFGRGRTDEIGKVTQPYGKRVMLLYGQESARKSGLLARVGSSLTAEGIEFIERGGVQPNPLLSFVRESVEIFRAENLNAIVAVGGGSVIDSAKAIAAGVRYAGDVWDFFDAKAQVKEACPIMVVLTLAATASEMNNGCVITNGDTQQKFAASGPPLFPRVSILDPENTFGVPLDHSMYGAVDAIIHVLEAYLTGVSEPTPLQDRLVEGLIPTIREAADAILLDPCDYDARANMMWAASLALNGLTTAGVNDYNFPMHMIEHSLSALYDISHGAGLGIVAPAWMRDECSRAPRKFAHFAERIFGITGKDDTHVALAGIEALENWFRELGVPVRLGEADIPGADIPRIAENAVMLAKRWGMGKVYDAARIEGVLRRAD